MRNLHANSEVLRLFEIPHWWEAAWAEMLADVPFWKLPYEDFQIFACQFARTQRESIATSPNDQRMTGGEAAYSSERTFWKKIGSMQLFCQQGA
jgi:hypothetical protein